MSIKAQQIRGGTKEHWEIKSDYTYDFNETEYLEIRTKSNCWIFRLELYAFWMNVVISLFMNYYRFFYYLCCEENEFLFLLTKITHKNMH